MTRFSTEELEDLYENAPCGYLSLQPDGRIDRVNATFLTWTGHGREELLGRHFHNLLNVAGKIYYETHFAPLLRMQGFFNEVALDLVAKDGIRIPVLVNAIERFDSDGNPSFIRITVFNATDRRLYERELLGARDALAVANDRLKAVNEELTGTNRQLDRANRELQAFYEALPVGIFRADENGRIVQASDRFCKLFGVDTADQWLSVLDSEDPMATAAQWHDAIHDNAPFATRYQVGGDDDAPRCIEMKAVPITGSEGGASAFVGTVEDVTEAVRIEAQTRQIARDAAVRQLTGGMAHNLNNILMVIMGGLEILEQRFVTRPETHEVVQRTLLATERAAALVSRLLVYSGYSPTRHDRLEIDPRVNDIATDLANRVGQLHPLTFDLCAPGAAVELDTRMLQEAIEELVANAVAAMPAGGEIHLATRRSRDDDQTEYSGIVVSISDRGVGMDQATLEKAHEPFFTKREVGQGLGLGLSLVDGIARIAGGELRLRSIIGKGTTAELHLPVGR